MRDPNQLGPSAILDETQRILEREMTLAKCMLRLQRFGHMLVSSAYNSFGVASGALAVGAVADGISRGVSLSSVAEVVVAAPALITIASHCRQVANRADEAIVNASRQLQHHRRLS